MVRDRWTEGQTDRRENLKADQRMDGENDTESWLLHLNKYENKPCD